MPKRRRTPGGTREPSPAVTPVAAMVEGANGSGRFGPTAPNQRAQSRFAIIRMDVMNFIDSLLIGNETMAGSSAVAREDSFSL